MKPIVFVAVAAALVATSAIARPGHHGTHHVYKAAKAKSPNARGAARGNAYAYGHDNQRTTVIERDARGRATKVSVEGKEYVVCTPVVTDSCINPRQAGLNFGNVPLDHWPGKPASEK